MKYKHRTTFIFTLTITADDTKFKLSKCRKIALGPDGIPNRALKVPREIALEANLYTSSLQLGFVPRAWKNVHVLMFLKPVKSARLP